jgi:type I restriction enzyme S subunit
MDALKAPGSYTFVGGPFGSELTTKDYVDEGVPVIRGNNLSKYGKFHDDDFVFVTDEKAVSLRSNSAYPGDLIFTQRGTLGQVGLIPKDATYDKYVVSQSQMKLTVDETKVNPLFVYYYFCLPTTIQRILGSVSTSGVPHINLSTLKAFKIPVPDKHVQNSIVELVRPYDDLIENNRRRIGLLEEAARLLYREWFVYFRFPGHEHVKITNGLPEGWERVALSDLAEFINGYPFKPSQLGDSGLPVVKIPELNNGVTEKTPRNSGEFIPEKYHLKNSDLLFSWSGTLAVNVWAGGPALLNQHLFRVISKGRVGHGFLMFALREALVAFGNQTVGATMKHIRRSALDDVSVALPERALFSLVDESLNTIYDQLTLLYQQNQRLAEARDLLLPRLMNGEIAV